MQRLKRRELFGSSTDGSLALDYEAADIMVADGVPLDYQRALYAKHEIWFETPRAHPPHAPSQGIPCTHLSFDKPYTQSEEALFELGQTLVTSFVFESGSQ
jgi:hypothetical protein